METSGVNNKSRSHWRLFLFIALTLISGQAFAQEYDVNAVTDAFNALKKDWYGAHGNEASELVDRRTLAYYERLLEEAKTYDSARLVQLPLYEKMMVLSIRMKALTDGTAGMMEKPFFLYATDKGLFNGLGIPLGTCMLGDITFLKDSATARFTVNMGPAPYYSIKFHYESDKWKVDLTSVFSIFSRMAAGTREAETEYILEVIQIAFKRTVDPAVWKPLVIQ